MRACMLATEWATSCPIEQIRDAVQQVHAPGRRGKRCFELLQLTTRGQDFGRRKFTHQPL
jgi:hypothetical protein